jgi:thiamine kinase-like enzyme
MDIFDGGSSTLKESYIKDEAINILVLGTRLGTWLARLHNLTAKPETLKLVKEKFDNEIAKSIYRYTYNNVGSVLEKFGFDRSFGERINKKFGSKLETDEVCLCHGDFWPGNILLEDHEPVAKVEEVEETLQAPSLTIVDWEIVRLGNGATDVGQFAAESWLLDRFHGGKGLLEAFLNAYIEERPLSNAEKIRIGAHFGTHITFYPSFVKWSDEEGTRQVIQIGKEVLEAVDQEDMEKLNAGPLHVLFDSSI